MDWLIDAALERTGRVLSRIGDFAGRAALWCWDEADDRRLRREIARGDRVYDPETRSWPRKV